MEVKIDDFCEHNFVLVVGDAVDGIVDKDEWNSITIKPFTFQFKWIRFADN